MTREEAQALALRDAIEHHEKTAQFPGGRAPTERILGGLYAGLRVVREKMTADTLRSNDLMQLIAIALDSLAASYYEASLQGEDLSDAGPRRMPVKGSGN